MKTYAITLLMLIGTSLGIKAQTPADSSTSASDNKTNFIQEENEDSTVIHIGDMKVVVIEDDSGKVKVSINSNSVVYEILTDKDNVRIGENGEIEIEKEQEEKAYKDEDDEECSSMDNVKTRYMMLDMGINGYLNENGLIAPSTALGDLELDYGKSINVQLHLFRQRLNLIRHHLNLMYGLTLDFNNYRFSRDITLTPNAGYVTPVPTEDPAKKSKLSDTYLKLPVLLNFESNPQKLKRSFHLSAGAYGGVLIASHTKVKTDTEKKIKAKDDFNLSKIRYGVSGQIGYGWFNIYANYALNGMFTDGEGPALTPFSVGISIIGF